MILGSIKGVYPFDLRMVFPTKIHSQCSGLVVIFVSCRKQFSRIIKYQVNFVNITINNSLVNPNKEYYISNTVNIRMATFIENNDNHHLLYGELWIITSDNIVKGNMNHG